MAILMSSDSKLSVNSVLCTSGINSMKSSTANLPFLEDTSVTTHLATVVSTFMTLCNSVQLQFQHGRQTLLYSGLLQPHDQQTNNKSGYAEALCRTRERQSKCVTTALTLSHF